MFQLIYDAIATLIGLGVVLGLGMAFFWGVIWLLTSIFHRKDK